MPSRRSLIQIVALYSTAEIGTKLPGHHSKAVTALAHRALESSQSGIGTPGPEPNVRFHASPPKSGLAENHPEQSDRSRPKSAIPWWFVRS
jgi:hypothetical protein